MSGLLGKPSPLTEKKLNMKFTKSNERGYSLLELLIVLAIIALFAMLLPARAVETYNPNFYVNVLTNGTATVTNGQTLAVTTKPFTLRPGRGLAIFPYFASGSTS